MESFPYNSKSTSLSNFVFEIPGIRHSFYQCHCLLANFKFDLLLFDYNLLCSTRLENPYLGRNHVLNLHIHGTKLWIRHLHLWSSLSAHVDGRTVTSDIICNTIWCNCDIRTCSKLPLLPSHSELFVNNLAHEQCWWCFKIMDVSCNTRMLLQYMHRNTRFLFLGMPLFSEY